MELEILRSVSRVCLQDQLSMGVPMPKDLLQITEQVLGQGRVEALLSHPLDQGNLLCHVPFAFGDVPVNLSKDFAFARCLKHGGMPSSGQCHMLPIMRLITRRSHLIRASALMEPNEGAYSLRPPAKVRGMWQAER